MKSGNYLGKARVNVYLSSDCREYIDKLSKHYGISTSAVIEMSVRRWYRNEFPPEEPKGEDGEYRRLYTKRGRGTA